MTLLVAREAEAAAASAARLRALGLHALATPVSCIRGCGEPPDLAGVQALAFTSRNGVTAFADASGRRDLPAFAVGPATAAALEERAFQRIETGPGDGEGLAALLADRLNPAAGTVLHAGGARLAFDVAAALRARGFAARHETLYRAVPAQTLPAEAQAALTQGRVEAALLYSAAGAERLQALCRAAGLEAAFRGLRALCLSPAVADVARALGCREALAATAPEEPALFALLGL